MITEGKFREDLYFRLAEIALEIPPLRSRIGDASLLANGFVRRFSQQNGSGSLTLTSDAIDAIDTHDWPGNVRELENCIKRAVIMSEGASIRASDLGLQVRAQEQALNLREVRDQAERAAVVRAMGRADGNLSKAAEMLGISRPTLYDLLDRLSLR
jgi:two-component system, NtrC family, response regulator